MVGLEQIEGLSPLDGCCIDAVASACLKNHWITRGINLGEHGELDFSMFSLYKADDMCALQAFFELGPHPIRTGVVYGGLAFVQQISMGDEWLVLRSMLDDNACEPYWTPFESYSFNSVIGGPARFECAIKALEDDDQFDTAVLFGASSRQRQARANS